MKDSFVQLAFSLLALCLGGAAEDLMPKVLGVGFPVLLAACAYFAGRGTALNAMLFAIVAGAFEDALSGLAPALSISFFLGSALVVRSGVLGHLATWLVLPAYELWLWIWMPQLDGSVFARLVMAFPLGALALVATGTVLAWAERRAGADA